MGYVFIALAQWLTLVLGAPLLAGAFRAAPLMVAGQQPPSTVQPWVDLRKLARRPSGARGRGVRIALAVHGGAILGAAALVPVWSTKTLGSLVGVDDLFLFFGMLTLSRIAVSLAAVNAGGAVAALGVNRIFGVLGTTGPSWLLVVIAVGVWKGGTTIAAIAGGALNASPIWLFLFTACFLALLVDLGQLAFDDLGSPLDLAHMEQLSQIRIHPRERMIAVWSRALRLTLLAVLPINLFYPWLVNQYDLLRALLSMILPVVFGLLWAKRSLRPPWPLFLFCIALVFPPPVLALMVFSVARVRMSPAGLMEFSYFPLVLSILSLLASAAKIK